MNSDSKRSLIIFGGSILLGGIILALWWFSGMPDPETFIKRYAALIVGILVGGYLLITIVIHLFRMFRDPAYCPRYIESYMGTGLMLAGWAERRQENDTQTCKTTVWLSVFFIPVIPLRSFLVRAPKDWGWFSPKPFQVIERIPLYRRHYMFAFVWWIVLAAVIWLIAKQ